jgi:acyl carrier protein
MDTYSLYVRDKVRCFLVENFLFDQEDCPLNEQDSFLDLGIIDSTGVLELVQFLEEGFQIEVTDEEMIPENLDSIMRLTNFVCGKKAVLGTI